MYRAFKAFKKLFVVPSKEVKFDLVSGLFWVGYDLSGLLSGKDDRVVRAPQQAGKKRNGNTGAEKRRSGDGIITP